MWVFFVLLLVPILYQHVVIGRNNIDYNKKNISALFLFFLFYTVLVMLRHESVGNDTETYVYFFETIYNMTWSDVGRGGLEIGFMYFNKIVSIISKDPQFFFAVTAIITMAMIYPTYKRLCLDPSLTIVLFCIMSTFVMTFSGIRQMLAIGLGFIAYEFTRKKKLIPFILIVLLAVTIHTSAFMLIFMYPLFHAKITKKWLLVVVPAMTLVFVFNEQIFPALTVFMSRFAEYEGGTEQTGAYMMLILFVLFAVFSFLVPDESKIDSETVGLRNFLLLSIAVQMFAPLHTIAMRMGYYYIIFIPLLIPKIIAQRSQKYDQVAIWGRHIMVAFFLVYFFIFAYSGGALHVFPYHFFWESVV